MYPNVMSPSSAGLAPVPAESLAAPRPSGAVVMGLSYADGPLVDPSRFVAPGTGLHSFIAYGAAVFGLLVLVIGTAGVGLFALIAAPIAEWFQRKMVHARIHGSALRVSEAQLPEVFHATAVLARRLGLPRAPDVYVVEDNIANAIATRIGGRDLVFLTDDVVSGCLRSGDTAALNFVIAHELAHHALGHTGYVRRMLAQVYRPLRRLDELTADGAAAALVGSPDIAGRALALMLVGPELLRFVSRDALLQQAHEVAREKKQTKKAERALTHPLLLRRIARVYGMA